MEHLAIHLPHEAKLGGPVQYRWMYPFERFMYHLKKKAKNKAKVEGSIVEQYVNEEISDFSSYYFESHIETKSRNTSRSDDGGLTYNYSFPDIPEIFVQGGRGSGKSVDVWLDSQDYKRAHSYVLLNCGYLQRFERCNWYDSTRDKGFRINKSGVIDVNRVRRYGKYDPFILASQADQYENDNTIVEADPFIMVDSLADPQEQFVILDDALDEDLGSDTDNVSQEEYDSTEDEEDDTQEEYDSTEDEEDDTS
ncbi:unnamed protein product [Microthlaspi erraticum]|uniref:DUF4218 domain-containing protein n=1 Tax=Microthlaspi erraticum TaxID=1685480 RepID=A0A6D2JV73_9BRAS|nr:unnamed protein product [Microthlaspi erraticum]